MRKGTKRKTAAAAAKTKEEEEEQPQQEDVKKEARKPKRAKTAKVESEPEYFDDHRELVFI